MQSWQKIFSLVPHHGLCLFDSNAALPETLRFEPIPDRGLFVMEAATSGGGGSAPTIRCRDRQRDNRLPHRSKRWQLLALLFVTRLCAALCGLVSGAAAAELNNVDPTEQRPLLLYIPMHVSETLEHLQEFCDRMLSKEPWVTGSGSEQKDEKNIGPKKRILYGWMECH